jgi:hypothetical protein
VIRLREFDWLGAIQNAREIAKSNAGLLTEMDVALDFYAVPPIGQIQEHPVDGAQFIPGGSAKPVEDKEKEERHSATPSGRAVALAAYV